MKNGSILNGRVPVLGKLKHAWHLPCMLLFFALFHSLNTNANLGPYANTSLSITKVTVLLNASMDNESFVSSAESFNGVEAQSGVECPIGFNVVLTLI